MLNKWLGLGNLTNVPELRYTQSGQAVANFSVAINDGYMKDGEWVEQTEYVNCETWGKLAERAAKFGKGDSVLVEGKLRNNKWEAEDGSKRSDWRVNAFSIRTVKRKNGSNGKAEATVEEVAQNESGDPEPEEIPF